MYSSKAQSEKTDELYKAILSLDSLEECYRFFDDLCTIGEIHSFTQRLEVAMMLSDGVTFSVIAEKTGASTATISRVNRCLQYGADGYTEMIKKLKSSK